jgi:chemotaxis protein CheX
MNVKYINPLLESTINVLSTMAMIEAKPGQPSLKEGNKVLGDVTGKIALSGEQTNGSLAISFSTASILNISEKMLGETVDSIDEGIVDLVGEITNIITGGAKRLYSDQGIEFDLTRPSMLIGSDQILEHTIQGKAQTIVLPFTTDAGNFYLEMCFN